MGIEKLNEVVNTYNGTIPIMWLCRIHASLHSQWLRYTGRVTASAGWTPGMELARGNIVRENREHVEWLMATRGVSDSQLVREYDEELNSGCAVM